MYPVLKVYMYVVRRPDVIWFVDGHGMELLLWRTRHAIAVT